MPDVVVNCNFLAETSRSLMMTCGTGRRVFIFACAQSAQVQWASVFETPCLESLPARAVYRLPFDWDNTAWGAVDSFGMARVGEATSGAAAMLRRREGALGDKPYEADARAALRTSYDCRLSLGATQAAAHHVSARVI